KLSYQKFKQIKFDMQLPADMQYPYQADTMFLLNASNYPSLSNIITTFKNWNRRGDADNKGAAIFLLTYEHLKNKLNGQPPRKITKAEAVETFEYVQNYMLQYFGTTDVKLGDIQKLVRGKKEWPLGGLPDMLSPQWTEPIENGKLKSVGGDGLIMFVRFAKNQLPKIETINMYGASAKPGSKHFDDQVEMYLHHQTKTMTLDKATVYKNAERIYHPQ
ncbi:MAG: penicillin acylase family protein, partial [Chitinophagaceae bacterium]|nr:penicillin acylase family protein [Chitinophagaceae bacterium]